MSLVKITWRTPKPSFSFIPKVRRNVAQRALNIAQLVWQGTVDRTPVASGELRASWTLSKGRPNFIDISGSSVGILPAPSMPIIPITTLGSAKFFISNGKSYVGHVEYGSPTNTPRLMLTRAIQAIDL